MKEMQKSREEPTLSDVMGVVEKLSGKFDTLSGTVEDLSGKFDTLSGTVEDLSGKFDTLSGTVVKLEVNLTELTGTVQDLTEAVQIGFAKVETRLDQHESIIKTLVVGQDNLLERVNAIDQRLVQTQSRVEDIVDEHEGTLIDHGRRIAILEKATA